MTELVELLGNLSTFFGGFSYVFSGLGDIFSAGTELSS